MESQRFCVCNLTRESLLGLEVAEVDSTAESLKKLIEYLFAFAEKGLWLAPYRGIPSVPGLAPFDLVCLDEDYRVIQEVELFSTAAMSRLNLKPRVRWCCRRTRFTRRTRNLEINS
jgi:hypothetical protein